MLIASGDIFFFSFPTLDIPILATAIPIAIPSISIPEGIFLAVNSKAFIEEIAPLAQCLGYHGIVLDIIACCLFMDQCNFFFGVLNKLFINVQEFFNILEKIYAHFVGHLAVLLIVQQGIYCKLKLVFI